MSKSLTPYPCHLQDNGKVYDFLTDDGVPYEAYFTDASDYFAPASFARHAVEFHIRPPKGILPGQAKDWRISLTAAELIEKRLLADPLAVITYVCAAYDTRQSSRAALFRSWFIRLNRRNVFEKIDLETENEYGAVLYECGHPAAAEIRQAAQELKDKE